MGNRLQVAHYDISGACNLRCEGCFFFDIPEGLRVADRFTAEQWDRFFAAESARGVNFAMLAGAEPTLRMDRLRLAWNYFPYGVIYSNGIVRVPHDIGYRIHLSMWGVGSNDSRLRGASVLPRAMANYRDDPRVVCVFTISALNVGDIVPAAELAREHGLPITYSYFSPSMNFAKKLATGASHDQQVFRISDQTTNPILGRGDFLAARRELERATALYPETVSYSLDYDSWISRDNLHDIEPETGLAGDCGVRLTRQVHYRLDWTTDMKCGAAQTECSTCRGYGPSYATYFLKRRQAAQLPGGVEGWYGARRIWQRLFMPLEAKPCAREGAPCAASGCCPEAACLQKT